MGKKEFVELTEMDKKLMTNPRPTNCLLTPSYS